MLKESECLTQFRKWIEQNTSEIDRIGRSAAFEAKVMRGSSIPFTALAEHQLIALKTVRNSFLHYKIKDSPIFKGMSSRFTDRKPFDAFNLHGNAWVVVFRYLKGQSIAKREAVMVGIDEWILLNDTCGRKSATWEMLTKVGMVIHPWKL